ncbi:MAG: coaE operon protein [Halobacteriaceae archaeon]
MIYSITVRVTAPVNETEVPERVAVAVAELFPEADVEVADDRVEATTHTLEHFAERLREQRILDTARSVFFDRRTADGFAFELKKQAARHDVVNFSVGNPAELGDVRVTVTVEDPTVEEFIDYLAPETDAEGNPIEDPATE